MTKEIMGPLGRAVSHSRVAHGLYLKNYYAERLVPMKEWTGSAGFPCHFHWDLPAHCWSKYNA